MSGEEEVREHEEEEEATTTTEVEVRARRPTREGIYSRCARVVYAQRDTRGRDARRATTEGGLDSIGTIGRLENEDRDGDWTRIETGRRGRRGAND